MRRDVEEKKEAKMLMPSGNSAERIKKYVERAISGNIMKSEN
jgi:hypothetical protein